jgi:PAS domain S-box-containing protein
LLGSTRIAQGAAASSLGIPRIISIWAALGPENASRGVWVEVLRRVNITAAGLCLAVAVRALIGQDPGITPFATLYPAIGIVALLAGVWAGAATLVFGWIAAWLFFFDPPAGPLRQVQLISTLLFAISGGVLIAVSAWLRDTISRLEQSAVRYRALIEASTSLVAETDRDGGWREREPAWEKLTGARWPDYRERGWLAGVHEEDRGAVLTALQAARGDGLRVVQARVWNQKENEWRWFNIGVVAIRTARGSPDDRIVTFADNHERKLARERQELLTGDLRHRLKNLVAVIRALLTSSLPKDDKVAAAVAEKFMARLQALQSAGDLVMAANWRDVDIRDIVTNVLEPFMDTQKARFAIEGPSLLLHEQTAGGIALASHELATNALKYGALSVPDGKVAVRWWVEIAGEDERVVWEWTERDGPKVATPDREGFGVRVIRSAVVRERENLVDLKFETDGVQCRMEFTRPRTTTDAN